MLERSDCVKCTVKLEKLQSKKWRVANRSRSYRYFWQIEAHINRYRYSLRRTWNIRQSANGIR